MLLHINQIGAIGPLSCTVSWELSCGTTICSDSSTSGGDELEGANSQQIVVQGNGIRTLTHWIVQVLVQAGLECPYHDDS